MTRTAGWLLAMLWLCVSTGSGSVEAASLKISEVLYDALGSDDGEVFVELFGPPGLALQGFTFAGVNGASGALGPAVALSGVIPEDGFFVIADLSGETTGVPEADLVRNFDLQNGPDSLVLRAPDGRVIDALAYGVFGPLEVPAGEGRPAPDPPAGQSLARRFANLDSDDNARDFVALTDPTPGFGPLQLPEPSSGILLAGAFLALLYARYTR